MQTSRIRSTPYLWNPCRLSLAVVSLLTVSVMGLSSARAQEVPLKPVNPKVIPNAVSLYVTQKGEEFFARNLEAVLSGAGLSIREGYFPELRYTSEKPIPLSDIAKSSPETGKLVQTVRELLQNWFMGLQINDPRPDVLVTGGGYRVTFSRLALMTDREALKRLGRTSGAVFALEAEIKKIDLGGKGIAVRDLNNEFIGSIGMLSPVLSLKPDSKALALRVPFFVDINEKGQTVIEALAMETNFAQTDMDLTYGQLVVPDLAIEINGKKFPLNKNYLVQTFEQMKPQLINQLKGMIDSMAKEALPKLVNDGAGKALANGLGNVTKLKPPGAPEGSKDADFLWGLTVRKIGLGQEILGIDLVSYVEDPKNPNLPLDPAAGARGKVTLAGSDPSTYDIALVVNRALINRILQLSHKRGYFNEIEAGPNEKLRIFAPPMIDVHAASANRDMKEPQIAIRVGIGRPSSGIQNIAINGEIRLFVTVIGRLISVPGEKGMRIRLEAIDEKSLDVQEDSLTLLGRTVLRPVLNGIIKGVLSDVSTGWAKEPLVLPAELPLPPELVGQRFVVQNMRMDRNGYLVMFMNFAGAK